MRRQHRNLIHLIHASSEVHSRLPESRRAWARSKLLFIGHPELSLVKRDAVVGDSKMRVPTLTSLPRLPRPQTLKALGAGRHNGWCGKGAADHGGPASRIHENSFMIKL